jgi:hypothetical protein
MIKTIHWPTNFNNKLACECMIHIDLAPKQPVPGSVLQSTIVEIRTKDESHPPTNWKLESIYTLQLYQLTSVTTLPSHAMESFDFAKWIITNNEGVNPQSDVAVYYYRKLKE